eukprot:5461561-Amphidinium_carterae.2
MPKKVARLSCLISLLVVFGNPDDDDDDDDDEDDDDDDDDSGCEGQPQSCKRNMSVERNTFRSSEMQLPLTWNFKDALDH